MGFERKFKDGDKVKVIDSNSSSYKKIGIIKWYGYPLCLENSLYKKKRYYVEFKTYSREFHSYQLEKIEESKEEINISENIELPLKEDQIITLLDGEKYQVVKNNTNKNACSFCSLYNINKGHKCSISHINNTKSCPDVIPHNHYFKWCQDQKIEDNSSKSLTISDLKPGMKVRIRPDLKEGLSAIVYVAYTMIHLKGTIHTIKEITLNHIIILNDSNYTWDIDCFSEIIEESKEKMNISENIELALKEGQVVTLLDGKKDQVIKNNTNKFACSFCSLNQTKCGEDRCNITHINGKISCAFVIPPHHYFKLFEDQQTEDNSSKSLTISDFKIGMKIKVKKDFDKIVPTSTLDLFHFYHIPIIMKSFEEKELIVENIGNCFIKAKNFQWYPEWLEIIEESQIFCENESALTKVSEETGIITKITFTLNEFKSEKLEHSKFTIL